MSLASGFGCLHGNKKRTQKAIYISGKLQSDQLQHSLNFADFFTQKVSLSRHTDPLCNIDMCDECERLKDAFEAALAIMLYGKAFVSKRA